MTAAPKLLTLTCSECGGEFNATRRDARTCSPKCRQDRSRRLKAEIAERLIEREAIQFDESEDPTAIAIALFKDFRRILLKRDDL